MPDPRSAPARDPLPLRPDRRGAARAALTRVAATPDCATLTATTEDIVLARAAPRRGRVRSFPRHAGRPSLGLDAAHALCGDGLGNDLTRPRLGAFYAVHRIAAHGRTRTPADTLVGARQVARAMVVVRGRARAAGVSRGRRRTGMCAVESPGMASWRPPGDTRGAEPGRAEVIAHARGRSARCPAGRSTECSRAQWRRRRAGYLMTVSFGACAPRAGACRGPAGGLGGVRRRGARTARGRVVLAEDHALTGLARIDAEHRVDRDLEVHRYAAEARLERDELVAELSARVAEWVTFSTILPSFTCSFGTCTPSRRASTTRCGVKPLSTIQSCIARNRYGRCLVGVGDRLLA